MPKQKIQIMLTTEIGPLWDARGDLDQLRSILGALWYLTRSHGDDELKDVNDLFGIIQMKIGENVHLLTKAIEQGKIAEVRG